MSWHLARLGLIACIERISGPQFDRAPFQCDDEGDGTVPPLEAAEVDRMFTVEHLSEGDDGQMGVHSVATRRARVRVSVRYLGDQSAHAAEAKAIEDAPYIIRACTDPDEFRRDVPARRGEPAQPSVLELVDELGEVRRRRVSRGASHTDIITDIEFAVSYTRDAT